MSQSSDPLAATRPPGPAKGTGPPVDGMNGEAGTRSNLAGVARRSFVKLVGGMANAVLGFALVLVVTRGLGKHGAGAFFEGLALFTIASNFAELGADDGLLRMIPRYRTLGRTQDLRRCMLLAIIPVLTIGSVLAVLLFVYAPQLASLFSNGNHPEALVPYIRVFAPWLPFSAASTVCLSATLGFGTVWPFVVVDNVAKPAFRPLAMLAVIAAGLGATGVALAWATPIGAGLAVAAVWLARLVRRAERIDDYDRQGPGRPLPAMAGEFWRFSAPRAFASVFATVVAWIDTLLVGALKGTQEAGIYASATRYLIIGALFVQAVNLVISPQISALLTTDDRRGARSVYQTSTGWLVMITWPLYLSIAVFSPLFLSVFGQGFVTAETALTITMLGMLVPMATGPVSAVLLMSGHSMANLLNTVVALALNIGLNLLLIPGHGIAGAALAGAISFAVYNLMAVAEVWLLLRLEPVGKGFPAAALPALLFYGGLGLAARQLFGTGLVVFVGMEIVATALFALVIWRFRRILRLGALKDAVRSRGKRGRRAAQPNSA